MTSLRTSTALAALACGLAAPVAAQDAFAIPEIVVSANIGETEASRTGASVSVLDAAEIEKTGETRLIDILARLPGVAITSNGPLGGVAGVTIRGVSRNYVKVLFDGIDIADPSGPQVAYDFGRLTRFGLDRVEVLRGSQSAVYGSQAVAGVISLGTALPDAVGTEQRAAIEAGSYETLSGSYSFGTRTETGALGLTLSHLRTDGFSAANEDDGNTEADGYEATRLSVRGEAILGDVTLSFAGFAERSEGDYDEGFGSAVFDGTPDEVSEATSRGLRLGAEFDAFGLSHEIALSGFRIDRTLSGTNGFGAFEFGYVGERDRLSWIAARQIGAGRLSFGADATRDSYSNDFGFGAAGEEFTTTGVFAEYDVALSDALDVTATLRHDDHSAFGGYLTGRLAAAWRAGPDTILRFSAGTGFRAPSGYELADPFAGNPDLTPEESRSVDLGIEHRFGADGMIRATLFDIETENLIDYSFATFTYQQVPGTTKRRGLELEARQAVTPGLTLTGAYTYTDSETPAGIAGAWSTEFGRHQLALGLDADLSDRLTASIGLLHVADRPTLPDYTTANATFTYDLGNAAEAYLRVENLADEDYELVDGYGTSGRAFHVGLRKSF